MNESRRLSRLLRDPATREFGKRYLQFSGMEFLFWFASCAGNYQTVFLQSLGFNATKVGVVSAVCSSVGIFATLFWGTFSDRIRSVRKVFLLCMGVGALLWALVPPVAGIFVGPVTLSLVVITLATFFRAPTGALMDNWVVTVSNREGMKFGVIRSFGSFSFAVMGIGLSFVLVRTGVGLSFYLHPLVTLPLLVLCFFVKGDTQKMKAIPFRELHIERLLKNRRFVVFLVFVVLLNMPAMTMMNYISFFIQNVHGDINMVGIIQGYKALLEIPVLVLVLPLTRRMRLPYPLMLLGTALFYTAGAVLFAYAQSFPQLVLISTLHGLGGGLFIASSTNYVYTLAPDDLKATAQTIYGSVNTVAGIVGNLVGGVVMDALGVRSYLLCTAVMILFSLLFYGGSLLLERGRQAENPV